MKIKYKSRRFQQSSLVMIQRANEIIEEYQAEGLSLTLRQLYYQFVSRDLIANKQREYKHLGKVISNARLAGLIDWCAIEDRTRNLQGNNHWDDPGEIIRSAARGFRLDKWENQGFRIEVWIEKEALSGVIAGICRELDIDYFACKGYVSQSEMWRAGQRLQGGDRYIIIHLGDHDPSGIDMTRDIDDREDLFSEGHVEVKRIALNMNQIDKYNPPPNPAKTSDVRYHDYVIKYGEESWELDALEPRVIRDLIKSTILRYRDEDLYQETLAQENEYKAILKRVEDNWETL